MMKKIKQTAIQSHDNDCTCDGVAIKLVRSAESFGRWRAADGLDEVQEALSGAANSASYISKHFH